MKAILPLIFALVLVRCGNFFLLNRTNTLEAERSTRARYEERLLSSASAADQRARDSAILNRGEVVVVSRLDLANPVVFHVANPVDRAFVSIGYASVAFERGVSRIRRSACGLVTQSGPDGRIRRFWADSFPLDFLLGNKAGGEGGGISYVLTPLAASRFLRLPFLLYFYLPLLIILIAAAATSPRYLVALFYYPLLALFFDTRQALLLSPFDPLFSRLAFSPSPSLALALAWALAALFALLATYGLAKRRSSVDLRTMPWAFILFFLLLPLALRF